MVRGEFDNNEHWSPMAVSHPDAKSIKCRDCIYRDRATIELDGATIPVGITRATCEVYDKEHENEKPYDVLFQNAECEYYIKEE